MTLVFASSETRFPDRIRGRVLSHLKMVKGKFPDDELHDAGEVFYYVGGKSWPTFVREIKRMERDGLIEINRDVDEDDDVWISLTPDPEVLPPPPAKTPQEEADHA